MTPSRLASAMTHVCPGGCGRAVSLHRYACLLCWMRLPAVLRQLIRANYRHDWDAHAAAVADGNEWFADNPPTADATAPNVPAQPTPAQTDQIALFDVPSRPTPTSDQLRIHRQQVALEHDQHPLSVALNRPIGLHADAAPVDDRKAAGLRCGGCAYRQMQRRGAWDWPKCVLPGAARITRGPGTDVRAWWPACPDFLDRVPPSSRPGR